MILLGLTGSADAFTAPGPSGMETKPATTSLFKPHHWLAAADRPKFHDRGSLSRLKAQLRPNDKLQQDYSKDEKSYAYIPGSIFVASLDEDDYADYGVMPNMKYDVAEAKRKTRRIEFNHKDWVAHRSSDRFIENMLTMFKSGIAQNLKEELSVVTAAAAFVVLMNCLTGEYEGLDGAMYEGPLRVVRDQIGPISLPAMPFSIAMSPLSLILAFRTNAAYSRWSEARTTWAGIINQCRNVASQVVAYFPTDRRGKQQRNIMIALTGAFSKSLRNYLRGAPDDEVFLKELFEYVKEGTMTKQQMRACMASRNRPVFLLGALRYNLNKVELLEADRMGIDISIGLLGEHTAACEHLFKTPIPLVYTRHQARFLTVFLALLPLGLWEVTGESWNHIATVPAEAVLAFFLLGIEEIGVQIEEPFSILPLEKMTFQIEDTMDELLLSNDANVWDMKLPEKATVRDIA